MRMPIALLTGIVFTAAACGGDSGDSAASDAAMADSTAEAPMSQPVALTAMNNSGATASATLAAVGDSTNVAVNLSGAAAGATLKEHIHSGTCETQGIVVATLDSLVTDSTGTAMASTVVNIPIETIANGEHYLQVHAPDGTPTACGDIPTVAGPLDMM